MSRRSSSLNRADSGLSREIGTQYRNVRIVANNIDAVIKAASVDLEELAQSLKEATNFEGITVVAGDTASWDAGTKTLTVPAVKGDTGDDLTLVSITPEADGAFKWVFSDGTEYTTPSLIGKQGPQGKRGPKGDTGEALKMSTISNSNGTFTWKFSDGTVYTTPNLTGARGKTGPKGDKGDTGESLTIDDVVSLSAGTFTLFFSDGTVYTTPNLKGPKGVRGPKGDKGDQGISVHHVRPTSTTNIHGDFGQDGGIDSYTFYGDPHETIPLGGFKVRNGYNTKSHADTAVENAALAEKWATEAVGVPVKDGKYSAYHHATKAALSETAAKDSETAASISEGIAANAASTAVDAADTAVTASDEAEATLKDFRERYYGSYTAAPTENPYGGPIELGDLYYDEVYHELRVWAEVGGTPVWKYAGAGPKGDNFSVHKVGLRSERSLYDNEPQGFCFFAIDETVVTGPLKSVHLPYSSTNEYLLEGFAGGPLSLVVTINGIVQSPAAYTVSDLGNGDYTLGISIEEDDTLIARELGRAFTNGAAYFKLSEVSADWSDPVPFSQGPKGEKGDKGDAGGIEEAPEDGKQYARKSREWVEVTGDVEDAPADGKQYARKDNTWEEVIAGIGPKGDSFSVHKVGLRSERSLYDDESQGFCFFATDETIINTPLKSEILPYSPTDEYLLEGYVGGALSLIVTVNGIIQSTSDYTVTDAGDGDYILGIPLESDDILEVREIGRAFTNGAAYFKLTSASGDWSDPVPFSQGPKGDKGDTGGVEEAPADGKQYARKDDSWVEVTGDVEEAPIDGKQYARKDASWVEVVASGGGGGVFESLDFPTDVLNTLDMSNFPDLTKNYTGTVLADLRPFDEVYIFSNGGVEVIADLAEAASEYPSIYTLESRLVSPDDDSGYWIQTVQFTIGYAVTITFQRMVYPDTGGTFSYDSWFVDQNSVNNMMPSRMIPYAPEVYDSKTRGWNDGEWVPISDIPTITENTDFVVNNSTELQDKVMELANTKQGLTSAGGPAQVRILIPTSFVFNSEVIFVGDHSWYTITRQNHNSVVQVPTSLTALFVGTQGSSLPTIDVVFSAPNTYYGVFIQGSSVSFASRGGILDANGLIFAQDSRITGISSRFGGGDIHTNGGSIYLQQTNFSSSVNEMYTIHLNGTSGYLDGGASGYILDVMGGKIVCSYGGNFSGVSVSNGGEVSIPQGSTAQLSQLPNEVTSAGIIFQRQ